MSHIFENSVHYLRISLLCMFWLRRAYDYLYVKGEAGTNPIHISHAKWLLLYRDINTLGLFLKFTWITFPSTILILDNQKNTQVAAKLYITLYHIVPNILCGLTMPRH